MIFTQPLFLLLLTLLPYFVYLGRPVGRYGRTRAWTALALRCLIVTFVVFSLAGAQSVHGGDDLAVVFLVDVSDSISEAEQEQALAFVDESLAAMEPNDQAALILFGADALVERPMMGGGRLGEIASIPCTHQTDLEGAIRVGAALFPSGAARRMLILSDGRPTMGRAEQAVRLAHAQGVQVDVAPLNAPLQTEIWLSDLSLPGRLHQDEEFTLSATVQATHDSEAVLTALAGDKVVAQKRIHLNPGTNTYAIPLTVPATASGFTSFRAYLTPIDIEGSAADGYPQNNLLSAFTMVEGPPRVLFVASESEGAYLQTALESSGLTVVRSTPGAIPSDPASLAEYGTVVLVDTPAQRLSARAMEALQSYVRDLGGGLVAVGGPHAYGVGGWYDTPLEESLPVEMTLHDPERFPPMSIVVVIDKSGSMNVREDGTPKIRLAGEAAARVAELINDLDEITVIAFDDRPADVIGPLPGSRRDEVIDRTTRLQAGGGGIYVRESLQEALGYLADSDRAVRHIILLSDGADSEHQEGVREMIEEDMEAITLSTVAIGAGQDLGFLKESASLGGGRYHFTDRAADLPTIFAEETQLAMRSYIVEEPFYPIQTDSSPILTGIEAAPQLAGYVATTPKPVGRVVLSTHQDDPLLVTWQYGLGRTVAWTSDATGRWAQRWVEWENFSRFWSQAVRWTIVEQSDAPMEATVDLAGEEAHVTVNAVDEEGVFVNGMETAVRLVGPDGEPIQVQLSQTAPGRYEGAFAPQEEGAYMMRLTGRLEGEEAAALTTGWVMDYSPEYAALESDPTYMAHLAELGDGAILEEPAQAFAHTLRGKGAARDLWPYLLALATLLLPFDVGVRRLALSRRDLEKAWAWVMKRLSRRQPSAAAETPSPVGRLFEAKSRAEECRPTADAEIPEIAAPPPAERPDASEDEPPSAPERPIEQPPPAPSTAEEGTLAGRLLKRKRERE